MRILSTAALAAIAIGTVAGAQMPSASGAPIGGEGDRAARWQEHKAEFEARRKQRADDIALLIGLRADQRPAFDALLAAMEPSHQGWGDHAGSDGKRPMGGSQDETMAAKLDHMSARIDERSAAEKARLQALRTFYASLSPDQRTRFDALDRLRRDHGGMHGGHGHGGPGMAPRAMG